jgi:hypothetical protein
MKKNVLLSLFAVLLCVACSPTKDFDPIGKWKSEFDTSQVDSTDEENADLFGILALSEFTYEFKSDYTGIRNAKVFGMNIDSEFEWSRDAEKVTVTYELFGEKMVEQIEIIERKKMLVIDDEQEVLTYLLLE